MKKIIFKDKDVDFIDFSEVKFSHPVFAKQNNKLVGMVIKEASGWILGVGGNWHSGTYHESLRECLLSRSKEGYEFFVEDKNY